MSGKVKTIILIILGLTALVLGLSYGMSGLAWFPGFFVAILFFIKIPDVNNVGKEAGK